MLSQELSILESDRSLRMSAARIKPTPEKQRTLSTRIVGVVRTYFNVGRGSDAR